MPLEPDLIIRVLVDAVARTTGRDRETLGPDVLLATLDVDSLHLSEILLDVEDGLDVEVPLQVLDRLGDVGLTLGGLADLLATGPHRLGAGAS